MRNANIRMGAGICLGLVLATSGCANLSESAAMRRQRAAAASRSRRIIYNNDSGDIYPAGADTPAGFLAQRMEATQNSQVESVFYCTGATTMFSHLARVGETYGEFVTTQGLGDNIERLKAAGHDVLDLVIEFCRDEGLEVFFTHRINDIHDSMASCNFELSRWKREHPEYCLGRPEAMGKYDLNDPRYWWSALDFELAEVRHYLIAILDDVCARYDLDGIEIDYFRSPMFFRPNLEFEPATPEQVEIMTGFQRRIRELAVRHGTRRGRPLLVATRVPMTPAACRHVGIDIEGWLRSNLLDVITMGGGYVPFTMPTEVMVKLGHAYGKPVYPAISASGMRGRHGSIEAWRGAAANAWHSGADGIYLFNHFPRETSSQFKTLGGPEGLRFLDKLFAIDNVAILEGDLRQGIVQSQILPVQLDPAGKPRDVLLPVADDLAAAAAAGRLRDHYLLLRLDGLTPEESLVLWVNGGEVAAAAETREAGWLTFEPDPVLFQQGSNQIRLARRRAGNATETPVTLAALELHVKYQP